MALYNTQRMSNPLAYSSSIASIYNVWSIN
jgi:hypothetical protein